MVHSAAVLHASTPGERALQESVNVGATQALVDGCRRYGVPRLIHVSTTATIGISERPAVPADESFRFNLEQLDLGYATSKRQAEALVLGADSGGLETVVANPGFVFGRHREGYRGSDVISRVLRSPIVPCTRGGLSVVHVDDVVDGIRRVGERGRRGERYILSGPNVSFHQIARTVARLSGERRLVVTVPDLVRDLAGRYLNGRAGTRPRLQLDRRYAYQYYSSEKARTELGYGSRTLAEIVSDVLDYLREP